jgi:hypothetical protein
MSHSVRTETVAADMDRIFQPLAGVTAGRHPSPNSVVGRERRRSRWWLLTLPPLVVAAGTALGLTAIHEGWQPPVAALRSAAPTAPQRRAIDQAAPAGARVTDAPTAVAPAPLPDTGVAVGSGGTDDAQGAVPRDDRTQPAAADLPRAARQPVQPIDRAPGIATARAPDRVRGGGGRASDSGCAPNSPENRCIYQDVLDAHGRLYRAYERARVRGVSNRDLTIIARRWREARNRADDDPDGAIRRYNQLADQLDDLTESVP